MTQYEYQKKWLDKNRDRRNSYQRAYYQEHLEKEREYQREWKRKWRRMNPEKARLSDQRRSEQSKQKRREQRRLYAKAHRHEKAMRDINRDRAKCKCVLSDEDRIRIVSIYRLASNLRKHGMRVHVDHKTPLAKGGLHHPDNLQIIPEFENGAKHCNSNYNPIFVF